MHRLLPVFERNHRFVQGTPAGEPASHTEDWLWCVLPSRRLRRSTVRDCRISPRSRDVTCVIGLWKGTKGDSHHHLVASAPTSMAVPISWLLMRPGRTPLLP